jgi:hypothetical protein
VGHFTRIGWQNIWQKHAKYMARLAYFTIFLGKYGNMMMVYDT